MKPAVSLIPEREPVPANTAPRRALTKNQMVQLCLDQEGKCGCGCGGKLDFREGIIDEHVLARGLGGSDDLQNRSLWRKPCSKKKTEEQDIPAIAKVKRLTGETCAGPKRPIPTHVNAWGPKGVRKIASRPFPTRKAKES